MQNVDFLLKRGVKIIVIACNTASAWALDKVRSVCPVPVVGVIEPGYRAAVNTTRSMRIGVIGTSATIRSETYLDGILSLLPDAHVVSRQCPLFVPLVEEGWLDHPVTDMVIAEYLRKMIAEKIDTLVLGCTHYPLIKPAIARFFGGDVRIICSSEAAAEVVKKELTERNLLRGEPNEMDRYYLTDHSATFQRVMKLFLGETVVQVEHVDIIPGGEPAQSSATKQ
jgi:glutamate racemase